MSGVRGFVLIGALIVAVLAAFSLYTVREWELPIKLRLGQIVLTDIPPGLHALVPFIEKVRVFDGRVMTLEEEAERYLTGEKKSVLVDYYVKWRIADVAQYYRSTGGDELRVAQLLYQKINDALRSEFGRRTIQEVISGERAQIMSRLNELANQQTDQLGIAIVDVRIKRIDLPTEVSGSVYQRMEAERARVARDFRSRGAEAAERIRADADRQRTVLLAEAYRDAERLRGEGDAAAAETYASAYGQNPGFFSFYRSLNAYRNAFNNPNDLLLLGRDSQFFRYFGNTDPAYGGSAAATNPSGLPQSGSPQSGLR